MEKIQIFRFAVLQVKRNRKESCVFIQNCLKISMCCGKAGDTTSIFSSQMQWHKTELLPHNIFSYLHICLFVISILVTYILLKVLPMLQLWLGRNSVFPNIV